MFTREKCRKVKVGNLFIGGSNSIIIQSMCNIKTQYVEKVIKQILKLETYGCQLIRVSILDENDALSIKEIKKNIHIPLVADIHFDYKLALSAIANGADKIRLNPGNITNEEHIKQVVLACKEKNIPIRIGVNSGSLDKDLQEKYGVSAKAMIESAKKEIGLLEKYGFNNIILSLKSSSYEIAKQAYLMAAELFDYPLHIGITETGPIIPGLSELIDLHIGSTIRISLSDNPIEEIKVAKQLLAIKGLVNMPTIISCPTCGRTVVNLIKYVHKIEDYLYKVNKNIKIAIMGCVVNGPGEAKEADLGIAFSNNMAVFFKKGKIYKTINEKNFLNELKKEINLF